MFGTRQWQRGILAVCAMLACWWPAGAALAQDPAAYFKQNCSSCHTIGGGTLTGPDLKDVSARRDRQWLVRFMLDPQAVVNSGDPVAVKLVQDARGVVMPKVSGINADWANVMLDLIDAESKLETSQFKGMQVSERPFTEIDVQTGRALFLGATALKAGGPSCIGCHTIDGLGLLGGGRLGPDLSLAYERLGGRKGLSVWLSAPATPTMQAAFAKHAMDGEEILSLAAYLETATKTGTEDAAPSQLQFVLLGMFGAGGLLVVFDMIWNRRFRSVRRKLVQSVNAGATGATR